MGVRARPKPDQGKPEKDGDHDQQCGGDEVSKQQPAVRVSGLKAQWLLPAVDIVTAST
jgi:hypothetical protein